MTEYRALSTESFPLKLTVRDFLLLDDAGAFSGYAKTELLDGTIYVVNAQYLPHARAKTDLVGQLYVALKALDRGLTVISEGSAEVASSSLPEPDITITDAADGDGPIPLASIKLVVEVSSSTFAIDSGLKADIYARAAIPEYWLVDLDGRRVLRMSAPQHGRYTTVDTIRRGEPLTSATIPGLSVETTGLA